MAGAQALDVANSFLDDIEAQIKDMDRLNLQHERENAARGLLRGDLARAKAKIEESAAQSEDVSFERTRLYFCEGLIYFAVAEAPDYQTFWTHVFHNRIIRKAMYNRFVKKWATPALASFQKAVQIDPGFQSAHYFLGLTHYTLGDKPAATASLTKAQQGEDREVSMEAAKALARMNEKKGFCFVATACYGSYDHPDVRIFRQWRDEVLMRSVPGRAFVSFYYAVSPPWADRMARRPAVAAFIRCKVLIPLAQKLKRDPH